MQQIDYQQAVQQLGRVQCLRQAMQEAYHLVEAIARLRAGDESRTDETAAAVAEVELACEQLRLIVGTGLVDLHKVAAPHRLQGRLRAHAQPQGSRHEATRAGA